MDATRRDPTVTGVGAGPDHPSGVRSALAGQHGPAGPAVPMANHVVPRPRVFDLLDRCARCPVTLVAAPAGWGKTLLAASWTAAGGGGWSPAWVRSAPGGDAGFWPAVAGALAAVSGPEAAAHLRRLAVDGDAVDDPPGAIAAALARAGRPVLLVLDDLHEVTSPAVHAGLIRLVERPPPQLSLLVLTRRDPPWPIARLRLAGLLTEVHAPDLAFRVDEAAELLALLRVDLDDSRIARLVERTEGWPAALRLVALHLQGRPDAGAAVAAFSGADHSVARYLDTEVLGSLPPGPIRFLERISGLDHVCADLADALTGRRDGAALLAELATAHLVVPVTDRPGRWYHPHRLVADLLRARPVPRRARRDLWRRATEWLQRNDMPVEALWSAVHGELWSLAAVLVGRQLLTLTSDGRAQELERALEQVPRTTLVAHPELVCGLAAARLVRGDGTEVAELVAYGRTRLRFLSAQRAARAQVLLDLVAGALARMTGNWDEVVALYRSAPTDPVTLAGLGLARAELVPALVKNFLGVAALLSADLVTAERDLGAAASAGVPRPGSQLNAAAHLSLVHCARGELGPAQRAAMDVVRWAEDAGLARTGQVVAAHLAMAHVALDRMHPEELDTWLGRAAAAEAVGTEIHLRVEAVLLLAARRAAAGEREQALTALRVGATELDLATLPRTLQERWSLTEAGLLAGSGVPQQARAILDRLGRPATAAARLATARLWLQLGDLPSALALRAGVEPERHPRGTVDAALLDTALATASEDEETALDRLEDALAAAAPWYLRGPFRSEVLDLRPLLERRLEQGTVAPVFTVDLLARLSGTPVPLTGPSVLTEPLTGRERTVLRYLASTLSNAEIAAELVVSVNTVKTHQRAVYRKFGVTNRRDAVERGRRLDLF